MTPYIIFFSFPLILHFAFYDNDKKQILPFYIFLFFIIVYLIGFRGHVGGDWNRYFFLFYNISTQYEYYDFFKIAFRHEYLFNVLLWFFKYFTEEIIYFQLTISGIIILNFFIFSYFQKRPFLAIMIAMPVGIFLLTMGYIRQGAAFSFILLSIIALDRKKILTAIIFFITSIGFHIGTIIFIPIYFLSILRLEARIILYSIAFILSICLIFILQYFSIDALVAKLSFFPPIYDLLKQYMIVKKQFSLGVYYRSIPFLLSVIIYLIFMYRNINIINKGIGEYFIILFILCIFLIIFDYTTVADRFTLFSLAFQIIVFANLDLLFKSKMNKIIVNLLVMLTYLIMLMFWLMNSHESRKHWQPFYMNYHYDKRYSETEDQWYKYKLMVTNIGKLIK